MPLVDLFITTCPNRKEGLFDLSLRSLLDSCDRNLYRLTLVVDGESGLHQGATKVADHILIHRESLGLGPSINQALAHIDILNQYYDNEQSKFICYCQDDVTYQKGWLEKLIKIHTVFCRKYDIGFLSGHNAVEHPTTGEIQFGKDKLLLKPWIRATNMFAAREYFCSMIPISRIDPETKQERARPHNGMGSSVDWWFLRNHPNAVCNSNRINIVCPGLVKHVGFDKSTWLNRPLPEEK